MKVDIIMRTKNRPIFLRRAIKDVLAQSYKNWHLCIVNDGGNISELEKVVHDTINGLGKIKIIHNEKSKGRWFSANIGLESTNGELIVIHDDDDTWHPQFLEKSVNKLQESMAYAEVGGVFCSRLEKHEDVNGKHIRNRGIAKYHKDFVQISDLMKNQIVGPITFVFKRKCLAKVGLFNEKIPVCGDWEFNKRFIMHYDIAYIDEVLAYSHFRMENNGCISNSCEKTQRAYDVLIENNMLRQTGKEGKGFDMTPQINTAYILRELQNSLAFFIMINSMLRKIKRFFLNREKKYT